LETDGNKSKMGDKKTGNVYVRKRVEIRAKWAIRKQVYNIAGGENFFVLDGLS
jgi:hypothetical protein